MSDDRGTHLSFSMLRSELVKRNLIPKYYDPELRIAEEMASEEFELPTLGALLKPGSEGSRLGSWIRREHYGSGPVPFVRTSDIHAWRIRPDFKKAVSESVYRSVAVRQDVKAGDLLMVAHGTYLVGTVAYVDATDLPLVLQDHVFRLRLAEDAATKYDIDPFTLLAALSTRFVRRQVRARQFSADIIDKIGERHLEIRVPIPKSKTIRDRVSATVQAVVEAQTLARGEVKSLLDSDLRMTRERSEARFSFSVPREAIQARILIPKYYDPQLQIDLRAAERNSGTSWTTVQELVSDNLLAIGTGVEVGKMAYGTGSIPFIRTTDIAELEIKADPRQGVSQAVYDRYADKAGLRTNDVILVRDGTYLVGSSAIASEENLPALICGGLFRIRWLSDTELGAYSLLGLLNLPLVRRQMRSKQFTRDVIDTLGKRFLEVRIPHPSSVYSEALGFKLSAQMVNKAATSARTTEIVKLLEPSTPEVSRGRPGWSMRG